MDIVERLRDTASCGIPDFTNSKLLDEAADEIERLRASEEAWRIIAKQNDRWAVLPQNEKEAALGSALEEATKDIANKDDEIERLRAAVPATGSEANDETATTTREGNFT